MRKKFFSYQGDESLEEAAQRKCGCPIPESVQGQVGQGFEQTGLVEGIRAHGRAVAFI